MTGDLPHAKQRPSYVPIPPWERWLAKLHNETDIDPYIFNQWFCERTRSHILEKLAMEEEKGGRRPRRLRRFTTKSGLDVNDKRPLLTESVAMWGGLHFGTEFGSHREITPVPRGAKWGTVTSSFVLLLQMGREMSRDKGHGTFTVDGEHFDGWLQHYVKSAAYSLVKDAEKRGDAVTLLIQPTAVAASLDKHYHGTRWRPRFWGTPYLLEVRDQRGEVRWSETRDYTRQLWNAYLAEVDARFRSHNPSSNSLPTSDGFYLSTGAGRGWKVNYLYILRNGVWKELVPVDGDIIVTIGGKLRYYAASDTWDSARSGATGSMEAVFRRNVFDDGLNDWTRAKWSQYEKGRDANDQPYYSSEISPPYYLNSKDYRAISDLILRIPNIPDDTLTEPLMALTTLRVMWDTMPKVKRGTIVIIGAILYPYLVAFAHPVFELLNEVADIYYFDLAPRSSEEYFFGPTDPREALDPTFTPCREEDRNGVWTHTEPLMMRNGKRLFTYIHVPNGENLTEAAMRAMR